METDLIFGQGKWPQRKELRLSTLRLSINPNAVND